MAEQIIELNRERFNLLDGKLDRILGEIRDLKGRMSAVEYAVVTLRSSIDRFDERLDRIERRMELRDAEPLS